MKDVRKLTLGLAALATFVSFGTLARAPAAGAPAAQSHEDQGQRLLGHGRRGFE